MPFLQSGAPHLRASQNKWVSPQRAMPAIPTTVHSLLPGDPNSPADAYKKPPIASWESGSHSAGSIAKPYQAIAVMTDLDGDEFSDADQDVKEDEAAQMARAMGTEKLHQVHQELFHGGKLPLDRLVELFQAAGLMASQEQVEVAMATLCSEATATGYIVYQQCEQLFLRLQQQQQRAVIQDHELIKAGRFTRWVAGLSDGDSTNLLLLIVVTLCCISAFLAGGLAILLLVLDEHRIVGNFLQENLGIVQDTLEVYAQQIAVQQANNRSALFITTMSSILQHVVFTSMVNVNSLHLSRLMRAASNTLRAWTNGPPQQGFANLALLTAHLTNISLSKLGRNSTASVFNEMNSKMPAGNELVLGQLKVNSTDAVEFLTQSNSSQCPNRTRTLQQGSTALLGAALAGKAGAGWTVDYCGAPVYAGYGGNNGLGVQYNVEDSVIILQRYLLQTSIISEWSIDPSNPWDFSLGFSTDTGRKLLTALPDCDEECYQRALADGTPFARALNGETGTMTYTDYHGNKALAVFTPVPNTTLGLSIQVAYTDIAQSTLDKTTKLIDSLNRNFPSGSEEFELTTFSFDGNSTNFTHLSMYKYGTQCPSGQCVLVPEYVTQAAANCSTGVMQATDYRGVEVLVSYSCVSDLNAVVSFKLDVADLDAETLAVIVRAVDYHSVQDTGTSEEFVVAKPNDGLTAADVNGHEDFSIVSKVKYPKACANVNCSWNRECALLALQDLKAVVEATDYRKVHVIAAPSRSYAISYGIGLALKQDWAEVFQPMMDVIAAVGCFTAGIVVFCTIVLILVTKAFMRSMIKAKEEGHMVVKREKERFSKLVSSMYPKFVLPQLLEGDKQLVCEVPGAAVFFSDIHEFTSASNSLSSQELLRLMGYVYGVMDYISDHFGVYKVKTHGDAYLAVRGLPGSESENPSLDLLRYASYVSQVFGDRFVHPTEGQVLMLLNGAMRWSSNGIGNGVGLVRHRSKSRCKDLDGMDSQAPSMPSMVPSKTSQSTLNQSETMSASAAEDSKVQCIMSYGLAVGKIVAGVLAGRCPMFDIWGGTVNLASRMQSTGEPGRIQVSEQLYKKVIAVAGKPFTFEAPRSTFCKGFGNVQCYMLRTTTEGLPRDLQAALRLEPRYGMFHFDNILTAASHNGVEGPLPSAVAHHLPGQLQCEDES